MVERSLQGGVAKSALVVIGTLLGSLHGHCSRWCHAACFGIVEGGDSHSHFHIDTHSDSGEGADADPDTDETTMDKSPGMFGCVSCVSQAVLMDHLPTERVPSSRSQSVVLVQLAGDPEENRLGSRC